MLGIKKLVSLLIMTMSLYIFSASPGYTVLRENRAERLESGRMKNVSASYLNGETLLPGSTEVSLPYPVTSLPEIKAAMAVNEVKDKTEGELVSIQQARQRDEHIRETTIQGGLSVKNQTGYQLDLGKLLISPPAIKLPADGVQILVIHTHASEAYTPAGLDTYVASDESRTEDTKYNIVRVGDELCSILEGAGLKVVHDRNIYDYPSYTGSYTRSGDAVQSWLAEYPGISVVIDVHRDALGENGVVYKTMAEEQGVVASQMMILVGTDESGLEHPGWQQNLGLALYLQRTVSARHPTLMRPVELVPQRYNQHLCPGSIILEVGSSGNTLQEALAAVRLFANAAAPALSALVQS
ncbi:MAG: stage II sporulation protein P [Oscillospiraceae bacterium]|nr:stage II sporulation protein P [Oscillospiraceae bacterium]MBQ4651766.1 stage II sporulation protein P [Oscillospiraceae bacterium]